MSDSPKQCRFCGCEDVDRDGFPTIDGSRQIRFDCGTVWTEGNGGVWSQDVLRCKRQIGRLYQRLSKALQALRNTPRFRLEKDDYGAYLKGCSDGSWCDWIQVENALEILEGTERDR